jgi:hypothetical protein
LAGYSCSRKFADEDAEDGWGYEPCTGVLILNDDATEIIGRDEYDGCEAILPSRGKPAPDGSVYFGPTAEFVPSTDCTLRVLDGETEFDDDFGARKAFEGSDRMVGRHGFAQFVGGRAVFPMIDEGVEPYGAPARWYSWDLESEAAELLPGDNEGSVDPEGITVDGRLFFRGNEADGATQYYEVTESGVIPAFRVTRSVLVGSMVRLR